MPLGTKYRAGHKNMKRLTWWLRCNVPGLDRLFPLSDEELADYRWLAHGILELADHLGRYPGRDRRT